MNRNLLDVDVTIDDVEEQVGDGSVPVSTRDPCPSVLLVGVQAIDGERFVVGDGMHAEAAEGLSRYALDTRKMGAVGGLREADHKV